MLVSKAKVSNKFSRKFLILNIHPGWVLDIFFACVFLEKLLTDLHSQIFLSYKENVRKPIFLKLTLKERKWRCKISRII